VKQNSSGEVIIYKARLVARVFVQRPRIDFDEIFAPIAIIKL